MKVWKVTYTYYETCLYGCAALLDNIRLNDEILRGATLENVRVDLRSRLISRGFRLYDFKAVQIDS